MELIEISKAFISKGPYKPDDWYDRRQHGEPGAAYYQEQAAHKAKWEAGRDKQQQAKFDRNWAAGKREAAAAKAPKPSPVYMPGYQSPVPDYKPRSTPKAGLVRRIITRGR